MKLCISCKEYKVVDLSNFHFRKDTNTFRNKCKQCWNIDVMTRYHNDDSVKSRHTYNSYTHVLKKRYKLSRDEYTKLDIEAGKVCRICLEDYSSRGGKVIDHCHTTGSIRGIVCNECNSGFGKLKDDISNLRRAILWLEK